MGCDPHTCLGFCDKAMSGFGIDGFVGRFTAAHFGQCNAGSPLNALMRAIQRFLARSGPHPSRRAPYGEPPAPPAMATCAEPPGLRRGLHREALHSVVCVDYTVLVTKTPPHPSCAGLLGSCPICAASARSSRRSQTYWHRLAHALVLGLSNDKRQNPSQRVTYTGVVVDTVRGTVSIPPEKKLSLASFLEEFFDRRECSMSLLDSLRGRIQHYSVCLPYILPFTALFSSLLGTEGSVDYDKVILLTPIVGETALFIRGVLEDYADVGRPLWPHIPCTLYASFLADETGDAHVAVISWDSPPFGWGAVIRWWNNRKGKVIVGSLPDSPDMTFQVLRETLGGVLALEAASREVDLSEAVVILRNDTVGVLSALRKGSFSSTFLQQCVMRACRLQRAIRCHTLHLHAPGQTLVDEGIDALSRDTAVELVGPVSGPGLRERALSLAASLGWTLTIDAF
jgi:hypothetical protein